MNKPITKVSFNKRAVAHMTVEQFVARFQPIYPDADLSAYADELGLISEPVASVAPATTPAAGDGKEPEAQRQASYNTSKRKTKGGKE